ncbi:FAD-dependent thymidylate synthase, partial [Rhodococcus hoagii]|nr:FAD-dependent thymidylate synthase [Prescottella equi]
MPLKVQLVAKTEFFPPSDIPWETDADGGEALAEFAGRACYQSWVQAEPAHRDNAGYLRHLLEVGPPVRPRTRQRQLLYQRHLRSCTHELIRHRHFSYSQLSQRFVRENDANVVIPPAIAGDARPEALFAKATEASRGAYAELLEALEEKLADEPNGPVRNKQARQAARSVLPNATETRVVVTGTTGLATFVEMRATEHADVEIRHVAIECLRQLQVAAPNVFGDFEILTLPDVPRWRRASSQRSS